MFPHSYHEPTGLAQAPIGVAIASDVAQQFAAPPGGVGLGPGRMKWADVPEAAVEEHGDAGTAEQQVGATPQGRLRFRVHAVAETTGEHQTPDRPLE